MWRAAAALLLPALLLAADERLFYAVSGGRDANAEIEFAAAAPLSRARRSPLEENPEDMDSHDLSRGVLSRNNPLFEDVDMSEDRLNETISRKFNTVKEDTAKYYDPEPVSFSSAWVDLDLLNASGRAVVTEHPMLSAAYRRAATIALNFSFPFYGHEVRNITIATGGFLYTGKYVHSWLAATQYIAPLMANFDTSQDDKAKIRYADNGTHLIVEWANVHLQGGIAGGDKIVLNSKPEATTTAAKPDKNDRNDDEEESSEEDDDKSDEHDDEDDQERRQFTFQAILRKNGDIVFAYKQVPIVIEHIEDAEHPVKVGLSDAYIIDRTIFFVRRKTIYEYHRVSMKNREIGSGTAIYFRALSTCNRKRTCDQCLGDGDSERLGCKWCAGAAAGRGLCSDGVDRNRQDWLSGSCEHHSVGVGEADRCEGARAAYDEATRRDRLDGVNRRNMDSKKLSPEGNFHVETSSSVHAGLATLIVLIFLLLLMAVWLCYAYFFPHTWSGQMLIKYRPTRWHWLRSEPRYTAASIHM